MSESEFKSYVYQLALAIGVSEKIHSIQLRKMTKKIASCSQAGRLTFDPWILEQEKEKIKEIIIHELLHLRYPNHGNMFKLMLKEYIQNIP